MNWKGPGIYLFKIIQDCAQNMLVDDVISVILLFRNSLKQDNCSKSAE